MAIRRWISLGILIGCLPAAGLAQAFAGLELHRFEELDRLMRAEPRPVAVFLHTDWCAYCQNMKHTSFRDEEVMRRLNRDYYFVALDGEGEDPIDFRGHRFAYRPRGRGTGTHELAEALGAVDGVLTYPTLVLLNPAYEIVFQHQGFLSARALRRVLRQGN